MKEPRTARRKTLAAYGGECVVYRDQAPLRGGFVFAAYTPFGIREIESEYAKRILSFTGDKKDRAALAKEIAENKHLHYAIRRNLLDNLAER